MKMLTAAGALTLLALAFPGAALAHTGSATVSCTAADYHFSRFAPGRNTVHYKVTVDNAAVARGDFTLDQFRGSAGDLHVPLKAYGAHTISAYAWWGPNGTAIGETGGSPVVPMATGSVTCAQPPPPAPAPAPPPAAAVTPPTPAPAPAPAPAALAPRSAVNGLVATSASARLGARTSCSSHTVRVTLTGRQIRDIAFTVNGRHVRTVTVRAGAAHGDDHVADARSARLTGGHGPGCASATARRREP